MLKKAERIAKKDIILFVPEGLDPQDKDDRGFGNDYYMTHRSVWYREDLKKLGFTIRVWDKFHIHNQNLNNALFCVKKL